MSHLISSGVRLSGSLSVIPSFTSLLTCTGEQVMRKLAIQVINCLGIQVSPHLYGTELPGSLGVGHQPAVEGLQWLRLGGWHQVKGS